MKELSAYHTISETSKLIEVPTHVLRFWETKFSYLNPKKGAGGRRYYSPEDVEKLFKIKHLLYEKGFTINGALNFLNQKYVKNNDKEDFNIKKIDSILKKIQLIKNILNKY